MYTAKHLQEKILQFSLILALLQNFSCVCFAVSKANGYIYLQTSLQTSLVNQTAFLGVALID